MFAGMIRVDLVNRDSRIIIIVSTAFPPGFELRNWNSFFYAAPLKLWVLYIFHTWDMRPIEMENAVACHVESTQNSM